MLAGADLSAASRASIGGRVVAQLNPLTTTADRLAATEAAASRTRLAQATHRFDFTLRLTWAIVACAIVVGLVLVWWLTRTIIRPVQRYSRFAVDVARGDLSKDLRPTGHDELADLGRVLDSMVARQRGERRYESTQFEFTDALQRAEAEGEAHEMLRRHLERSIDESVAIILNRNNSENRLQAMTELPQDPSRCPRLDGATPRSCLAIRFARQHQSDVDDDPLVECQACGACDRSRTCTPLLVNGEVIGSVLLNHPQSLDDEEGRRIRDSVGQAAPVLANLRSLALAELRAATDTLTGLPNRRAVEDTLKRMVAQSARTGSPLGALILDLDHFKDVNDTLGHGKGDEVLAAVGDRLRSVIRASDFAGRFGGEEFLVLLPDSDVEGTLLVAEKLRLAICEINVPQVDRAITVSIGAAVLPVHALVADGLIRASDRALYSAKRLGRNRVEVAGGADDPSHDPDVTSEADVVGTTAGTILER